MTEEMKNRQKEKENNIVPLHHPNKQLENSTRIRVIGIAKEIRRLFYLNGNHPLTAKEICFNKHLALSKKVFTNKEIQLNLDYFMTDIEKLENDIGEICYRIKI